ADEDHTAGAVARLAHRLVVGHVEERRLLDEDVFAGRERLEREIEVKLRRHGDDDRVDIRACHGLRVAAEGAVAAVLTTELLGAAQVAAGVAADDIATKRAEIPAVHPRDEPAPEKSKANRLRQSS